jgi:hypothetical protein
LVGFFKPLLKGVVCTPLLVTNVETMRSGDIGDGNLAFAACQIDTMWLHLRCCCSPDLMMASFINI